MSELDRQWLKDKRELELEKQLNSLTLRALRPVTERERSPSPKILSRPKSKPTIQPNTPEYTADLDLRDIQ